MKLKDKITVIALVIVGLAALIGLNALAATQVTESEATCEWHMTQWGTEVCR